LVHGALHRVTVLLEPEDVDGVLDDALVEEQLDLLGAEPLDVERPTRHEMLELLHRLCGADELAGTAAARIFLAGLLVDLAHRGRAADRADVRELIWPSRLGPLVEQHLHDLRDHVAGPLDHHGVADADIGTVADRLTKAVEALDVVFIMERDIDHGHAADGHRIEPPDRRERTGAADLDIDLAQHGGRALRGKLVRNGPAWLAAQRAPAALQLETVDLVDDAVDVVAERGPLRLDFAVLRQELVDRLGARHQRADPEPPAREFLHRLVLAGRRIFGAVAPGVGEEVELAARGHRRVLLAQRAGRGVAWIDVVLPADGGRPRLQG